MQIIPFCEAHIDEVIHLMQEFDAYLASLGDVRWVFSFEKTKEKIHTFGFGSEKSFDGYVAQIDDEIVGYALYHYGFDPDEMQGKVIYLIDFFVSNTARGQWVGTKLMQKLQSHSDALGIYFCVWKKNVDAIRFYEKLWAEWCKSTPYMRLLR